MSILVASGLDALVLVGCPVTEPALWLLGAARGGVIVVGALAD